MLLSEISYKAHLNKKRRDKRYSFFRSPDSDFDNTKVERDKADLFHRVTSSCHLPSTLPDSKKIPTIIDSSVSSDRRTCLLLCDQLDTKQIIEESRRLYRAPSKPFYTKKKTSFKEQIGAGNFFKNLPRPFKMDEILRENFPTTADPNCDPNWRLAERKSGLKKALRYHLALMKNYEPEMYNFCYQTAKEINTATPLLERPEAILPIAVHQDEPKPCLNLISSLMQQKDIDLRKVQICFFVNGDDSGKVAKTMAEIRNFIASIKLYLPDDLKSAKLTMPMISVVAAPINSWRFGLKAIPLNIAIMQLMLSGLLEQSDADLPVIFLDADLQNIDCDLIKTRINSIHNGYLIAGGSFRPIINSKENSLHINLELAKMLYDIFGDVVNVEKYIWPKFFTNYNRPGSNSAASLMALAYTGSVKPYSFWEEFEWQEPIINLFSHAFRGNKFTNFKNPGYLFGINRATDRYKHHLLDPSVKANVYTDGGKLRRALEQGQNLDNKNIFGSHDGEIGTKIRIDFENKKLNIARLKEDIDYFVDLMINLIKRIPMPKDQRKVIMELALKTYQEFISKAYSNLKEYEKELKLIKAMLKDSFSRYIDRKIRIHS